MQFIVNSLRYGDEVEAVVTELLSGGDVIMSFQGDLMRVQNQSRKSLFVGEKLLCKVIAVKPLRFALAEVFKRSTSIMNLTI